MEQNMSEFSTWGTKVEPTMENNQKASKKNLKTYQKNILPSAIMRKTEELGEFTL